MIDYEQRDTRRRKERKKRKKRFKFRTMETIIVRPISSNRWSFDSTIRWSLPLSLCVVARFGGAFPCNDSVTRDIESYENCRVSFDSIPADFTSRCVTRVQWTIMKSGLQTEEKQWPTYERSISKFAQLWDVHFAKLAPMDNGIYADDPCAREDITEAGCKVWPVCNFRDTSRAHAK